MRWKVLITAPYMQPVIDRFKEVFDRNEIEIIVPHVNERFEEEELLGLISDIDGVICGDDRFTERVLRAAPKLKVISKWGTGIDSIDKKACKKLCIAVKNTPNAFTEPVSDTVLSYILCFARKVLWTDKRMKEGIWEKIPSVSLSECTLGVIGVGNVGKAVVRKALAFGMNVFGNDIIAMPDDFVSTTGIEMVSKDILLEKADFISLNCELNSTSYHLISDAQFLMMKSTSIIINTSRGPVIDESALIRALKEKRIAGAALDVFEYEPLPMESPLRKMDNVLLAPHNSNSSPKAWERVHLNTINNLLEALRVA